MSTASGEAVNRGKNLANRRNRGPARARVQHVEITAQRPERRTAIILDRAQRVRDSARSASLVPPYRPIQRVRDDRQMSRFRITMLESITAHIDTDKERWS